MKLFRDQIILRPDDTEDENKTSSGIILAAPTRTLWATGEVVQVGEYGSRNADGSVTKTSLSSGDRVLYRKHQVENFNVDGGEVGLVLTTENAVVGVLEEVASAV